MAAFCRRSKTMKKGVIILSYWRALNEKLAASWRRFLLRDSPESLRKAKRKRLKQELNSALIYQVCRKYRSAPKSTSSSSIFASQSQIESLYQIEKNLFDSHGTEISKAVVYYKLYVVWCYSFKKLHGLLSCLKSRSLSLRRVTEIWKFLLGAKISTPTRQCRIWNRQTGA